MNKLWLIFKREYLVRVKKRSFILTTLLTPLAFVFFFVVVGFIMSSGKQSLRVVMVDESGLFSQGPIPDQEGIILHLDNQTSIDSLRKNYRAMGYDGVLYKPDQDSVALYSSKSIEFQYLSDKSIGASSMSTLSEMLEEYMRKVRIQRANYDPKVLESFEAEANIVEKNLTKGEQAASTIRATALGSIMGILIYMVILIYGSMVMRSVMEEKNSRIIEVIVSSVRPFQLMLGKIIGVGAVGLTQFLIWAITLPLLYFLAFLIIGPQMAQNAQEASANMPQGSMDQDKMESMISAIQTAMDFNYFKVIVLFLLFFLGGYFLYASLFAALGSAMGDDLGESQSLSIPVTIPVALSFYIGISVVNNPNSSLAFWSSLFPLFSPVVMTARLGFDPPWWQIILSLVLLFGTCAFFIWVSGRIYRVGILMYGKQPKWKEIWKWMFYKD